MTRKDLFTLREKGLISSKHFKTATTYRYQMVTVAEPAHTLLGIYVDTIRPQLVSMYQHEDGPSSPGILNYDGHTGVEVGRRVTEFCREKLGLHITTTAIRSLVETEMDDRFRQGIVGGDTKAALHGLGGHSSATTTDHYIRRRREDEVSLVNQAWPQVPMDEVPPTPRSDEDEEEGWGIHHPYYHTELERRRVPWSRSEKEWLAEWMKINHNLRPSQCLSAILKSDSARHIFHRNHIRDATRIEYGMEKIKLGKWKVSSS